VLVGQLRDHLRQLWGDAALAERTTEHPLQPFSRRYFESPAPDPASEGEGGESGTGGARLFTYAREWRVAHEPRVHAGATASGTVGDVPGAAKEAFIETAHVAPDAQATVLTITDLARFVRNPVAAYFAHRLRVRFDDLPPAPEDDELFELSGLDRHAVATDLLDASRGAIERLGADAAAHIQPVVQREIERLARAGRLPLGAPGRAGRERLLEEVSPALATWHAALQATPQAEPKRAVRWPDDAGGGAAMAIQDWLLGLRRAATAGTLPPLWIGVNAGRIGTGGRQPEPTIGPLAEPWVRQVVAAATGAAGEATAGVLIGRDGWLWLPPVAQAVAQRALRQMLQAWATSMRGDAGQAAAPLPTAWRTGTAHCMAGMGLAADADVEKAYQGDGYNLQWGEGDEPSLARLYPDFETLSADPAFEQACETLYADAVRWFQHVRWFDNGRFDWPADASDAAPKAGGDADDQARSPRAEAQS
jgi:exodeoxyribonuclease V gamma subunit